MKKIESSGLLDEYLNQDKSKKYRLELTYEQLSALSTACEFYARVRMGQFGEIPFHLLEWKGNVDDLCTRREEAEKLLLEARKHIYPELNGYGHSYGIGKFEDADLAFDIYQVARNKLGCDKPPFSFHELPKIWEVEEENRETPAKCEHLRKTKPDTGGKKNGRKTV